MTTLSEQIAQVDWNKEDSIIRFYEDNQLYFDNYQELKSSESVIQAIEIKLHYCNVLVDRNYLDKALPVLGHIDSLLVSLDKSDPKYEKYSNHKDFLIGMIRGQKRQFKEAYPIFKKLVQADPEHHYYKVWYKHCKIYQYHRLFSAIAIFGVILVLGEMFLDLNEKTGIDIGLVGLGISFIAYLMPKYIFKTAIKESGTTGNNKK